MKEQYKYNTSRIQAESVKVSKVSCKKMIWTKWTIWTGRIFKYIAEINIKTRIRLFPLKAKKEQAMRGE